jgi:hypothetical protein
VANYIAPHRGGVVAFERASGRPLWRHAVEPPAGAQGPTTYGFAGSPALGRYVYAASIDGTVHAFAR